MGIRASQENLEKIEIARTMKGLTLEEWAESAYVSVGTINRFRAGTPIAQSTFVNICKALGIENWEDIVDKNPLLQESKKEQKICNSELKLDLSTWQLEKKYQQFIGRNDDLQEILQIWESEYKPRIFSITGIGGLGKTAFCHQLVSQAYQAKLFTKIAWVRARIYQYQPDGLGELKHNRDFCLSFDDALKEIGKELKLANNILLEPDLLKSEISKMLNSHPWLIVIDGLEDAESPKILSAELQKILGQSSLIITSRRKIEADVIEFQLSKLNKQVSREFIQIISEEKYLPRINPILKATPGEIDAIVDITDGMPLAMKLLVSQAGKINIDRIIQRLQNIAEEQQLYDYLFEDDWQELQRENAINAQKVLLYLSIMCPPVPIGLLYDLDGLSSIDVDEAVSKLFQLSLIEISPLISQKEISMHSFTARYFGETLKKHYEQSIS